MQMTQAMWDRMSESERAKVRSDSGLTKQLIGLEGWRVEVVSVMTGEKRRFIVGRSTGWVPCHIELSRRTSHGGVGASHEYASVRKLYKVRDYCSR
jgi:hypothetical protein